VKKTATVLACALLLVVILCLRQFEFSTATAAPATVKVEGTVIDAAGAALPGATVLLVPDNGGKPQTAKTGKGGEYGFTVPTGLSIDILYAHPDAGAANVSVLSGQNDQKIHIVLFQTAQVKSMSDLAIHAELASFERLAVLTSVREDIRPVLDDTQGIDWAKFPKARLTKLSERLVDLAKSKEAKFLEARVGSVKMRFGTPQ
jgi:hypothetical protein